VVGILVLTTAGTAGRSANFGLLWIAMVGWNAYWFLLRIVYQFEVGDGVLSWRAPLRSGQVPVTEVIAIRPSRLGVGYVVATRRGAILVAFASQGFGEFAAALQALQPSMAVRVGRLSPARAPRRWRDGSGFYRSG
jgi:hypothetical protein